MSGGITAAPQASRGRLPVTLLALLAGAMAACLVLLWPLVFGAPVAARVDLAPSRAVIGSVAATPAGFRIDIDTTGRALLALPLDTDRAPALLALRVREAPPGARMRVFTRRGGAGEEAGAEVAVAVAALIPGRVVAIDLRSLEGWPGRYAALLLGFEGAAGSNVTLAAAPPGAAGWRHLLANLRWGWTPAGTWSLASANNYAGLAGDAVAARPAALGLFAVAAGWVVAWAITRRRWDGVARRQALTATFLVAWLCLDALWLHHLEATAREARAVFGTRSDAARALAGPDRDLVLLARRIDNAVGPGSGERIFVASASEFRGMRAAYYLYPRNVFWERDAELPDRQWLRTGDHVLLLAPTAHRFDGRQLFYPGVDSDSDSDGVPAQRILDAPGALLVRIR